MVRTAHVLGSPVVRTFVGRPRASSAQAMAAVVSEAAAAISQVTPVCDRYRTSLAIENHRDLTSEELVSLLELVDSEWVGICFDTGNSLALLEDPLEAAEALEPLIKTVHLKDYQVVARATGFEMVGCALGEGVVDLRGILDLLGSRHPEVRLNLASAVEKEMLPVLEEEYLEHFPETPALALGRTLRLVRDRGLREAVQLAAERGAPEDEILAEEDDLVLRSVGWARQALGRAGSDLPNSRE